MVIALAGSLGMIGIARGLVLPGTIRGVVPLNPVGGVMAALMLLCTPAAMGIWLGRSQARPAALAGALGGGAVWLCSGPLAVAPGLGAMVLQALPAAELVPTSASSAAEALDASLRMLAVGLPAAMLVGAGLTWSGAEFSARPAGALLRPDPVARMVAAGTGLALAAMLAGYIALGTPDLPRELAPMSAIPTPHARDALVGAGVLLASPPILLVLAGQWALRARGRLPGPHRGLASPLAAGAWTFVALLWAAGLPLALSSTFGAGILPLTKSPPAGAPATVDAAVWDAMYDHTMVALVVCMLTGLVVTTVTGLFVPLELPEDDEPRVLDWFR